MQTNFCTKCGIKIEQAANFCPQCGQKLGASASNVKLTPARFSSVALLSLFLLGAGWFLKESKAGKAPDKQYVMPQHSQDTKDQKEDKDYNDPELEKLRKASQENPKNIEALREFTGALIEKIRMNETPPPALVFETIDSLRAILDLDAKDPNALIAMADISFDQQAFAKAVQFYERFLEVEPDDVNARARYASSLTFINQFDKALNELGKAEQKDPKNFHVKAYTAIVYAQMGKKEEARKAGQKALELAPNEDAKKRFTQFIENLDKTTTDGPISTTPKRGNLESDAAKPDSQDPAIVAYIKNNPIAGPKFSSFENAADGTLVLLFNDFPMEMMPPFAKEKFFSGIKDAAQKSGDKTKSIVFKDATSRKELSTLQLP